MCTWYLCGVSTGNHAFLWECSFRRSPFVEVGGDASSFAGGGRGCCRESCCVGGALAGDWLAFGRSRDLNAIIKLKVQTATSSNLFAAVSTNMDTCCKGIHFLATGPILHLKHSLTSSRSADITYVCTCMHTCVPLANPLHEYLLCGVRACCIPGTWYSSANRLLFV